MYLRESLFLVLTNGTTIFGLRPCDHSIAKVNISEQVLYTTAERAKGDATCEAERTVENLS